MKTSLLLIFFNLMVVSLFGQVITQTIRGTIFDKDTRIAMPGANVVLLNSSLHLGTTTDGNGNFRLEKVPVGRQSIQISFIGYKQVNIDNLIVSSGKETVLEINLEEDVTSVKEVTILANTKKEQAINKMTSVSSRSFTVEETEKYAGSRGDVARMAMNYAGVSSANDQRNDIVIRGNSPSGLLWRMEDVDIPNPNHFAENGTTGGPVGMLNNNLLVNSDFLTSAFPAEYGNAISGVFDLKMRNGNNEKHEYLFQSGFNGFELGAEGPFTKNHKSSYLANFRYSTLELMDNLIDIGTSGVPKYSDFSYKLNFPLKNGHISVFGLAGKSKISMLDSKDNKQDMYSDEGQDLYNYSKMGTTGVSYTRNLGTKTYLKLNFTGLYQSGGTQIDTLDKTQQPHRYLNHDYAEFKLSGGAVVNSKLNSFILIKSGVTLDRMGFDLKSDRYYPEDLGFRTLLNDNKSLAHGLWLLRSYAQASLKLNDRFTLKPGIHVLYFDQNQHFSVEPRMGVSFRVLEKNQFNLGYGLHSQIQSLSTYFINTRLSDQTYEQTNTNLDPTKSHQFVAGFDRLLSPNTRLKVETYYQYLFQVPVEKRLSSFSLLNTGATWGLNTADSLENKGTGKNYGVELTLERFFSKNFYYLCTVSLFESKYKGSDGIERNTAFNGNYVVNVLIGKEFQTGTRSAFTIDYKLSWAGGKRYTPIDMTNSYLKQETEYLDDQAFSKQFPAFFKTDIKFGYRLNGKKISQEWQFYVENFTNHKNPLMQTFSRSSGIVHTTYQLGVFPMVLYRIHF